MKPESFLQSNTIFAKDQEEYLPLPAYINPSDPTGTVLTCWRGSWRERWRFLLTGMLWMRTLTFKMPLQPMRPQIENPFLPAVPEEAK